MNIAQRPDVLAKLQSAANITTEILKQLYDATHAGISAAFIDQLAGELCLQYGVVPSFRGVGEPANIYNYNLCVSVNEVVLHGVPHKHIIFQPGDVVKLDFGLIVDKIYTDQCVSFILEPAAAQDLQLLEISKIAVLAGVKQAKTGNKVGDIGHAIYSLVDMAGYDVLREFVGHGIGGYLHESPEIPAYGKAHSGYTLIKGDVLCVEAQVVAGLDDIYIAADNWSVITRDGKKGAMFEYMVIVDDMPINLTQTLDWPLVKV